MIPVNQTRFATDSETEAPGNCYAACIASILELKLRDVPDEANYWKPGMSNKESWIPYNKEVHKFLRERGLTLIEIPEKSVFFGGEIFDCYSIISGPSPRNNSVNHAVVGQGNSFVHDPHPSKNFILRIDDSLERGWYFEFLVPIDVARFELKSANKK